MWRSETGLMQLIDKNFNTIPHFNLYQIYHSDITIRVYIFSAIEFTGAPRHRTHLTSLWSAASTWKSVLLHAATKLSLWLNSFCSQSIISVHVVMCSTFANTDIYIITLSRLHYSKDSVLQSENHSEFTDISWTWKTVICQDLPISTINTIQWKSNPLLFNVEN